MGKNVIEKGMVVKVHYKGTLPESGEVFDSSEGRDPLKFTVGKGEMRKMALLKIYLSPDSPG